MKYIKTQQGYTLVLILGIFVIFMILGFGMMTMTMQGAQKSESRESVTQAKDLSVKGIDYIISNIEKTMQDKINASNGLTPQAFETEFSNILAHYNCSQLTELTKARFTVNDTHIGVSQFCITEIKPVTPGNLKLVDVTFKGTGTSNNKEITTHSTYRMGSSFTEDQSFAILTYGNQSNLPTSDIGNIDIHGGVKVIGNIHADNNIFISDSSRYKGTIVPSILPIFLPAQNSVKARLEYKNKHLNKDDALSSNASALTKNTDAVSNSLSKSSFIKNDKSFVVNFNLNEKFTTIRSTLSSAVAHETYLLPIPFKNYGIIMERGPEWKGGFLEPKGMHGTKMEATSKNVYLNGYNESLYHQNNPYYNWTLYGNNTFQNVKFFRNLYLAYGYKVSDLNSLAVFNSNPDIFVKSAYIEQDLIIGLNNKTEVNFDLFDNILSTDVLGLLSTLEAVSNIETPVNLEGTYYVNGDLIIANAKLTGDATIYVNGKTSISFSEINPQNNSANKINIISNGPVDISYVSNNHNDFSKNPLAKKILDDSSRSYLNGHIHSNEKVTIDGATSYLTINGSITAPNVYITSIKGVAAPSCRSIGYYIDNHLIDGLLAPLLSLILGTEITQGIINLLTGKIHEDSQLNVVTAVNNKASNCFTTVDLQNGNSVIIVRSIANLLGIQLLPAQVVNHPIDSRVIINYEKNTFNESFRQQLIFDIDKSIQQSRD
jgi:cytoskeletal protein CcmA (bactofilin family)